MARARNLKPSIFKNEVLGMADPLYTILFEGLWTLADREGRLEDRPLRIKAEVLPYRDGININELLDWLHENQFITRYSVDGKAYIEVTNFLEHQNPHVKEPASTIPAPVLHCAKCVQEQVESGSGPADSLNPLPSNPIPLKGAGKPARFDPLTIELPDCVPSQVWADWIAYRRQRKLTCTEATIRGQLRSLETWSMAGHPVIAIVSASINNGWQGLFEPKARGSPSYHDERKETLAGLTGGNRNATTSNERDITAEAERLTG